MWYNLSSFTKSQNVFYKNNPMKVMKSRWARLRRIGLGLGVAFLILWGGADAAIRVASSGRVYSKTTVDAVPSARAAVVLGCSRTVRGGLGNLYYQRRIRAAADLYASGKVRAVVVSGDNHVKSYDEPTDMKGDLVACGVPADRIVCDYAGFRTLDSVIRASKVFGLNDFIVVSQPFHVRSAVFLARGFGINAVGYEAEDVSGRHSVKTCLREQLAKIAALIDVVIRRQPKFLGPLEKVPE